MIKDDDDKKWKYTEHAAVKHLLLKKYLQAWIVILGKYSDKIAYFDGFAGKGIYQDGNEGSPILAMKACQEVSNFSTVKKLQYKCVFVEANEQNYNNLNETVKRESYKYPVVSEPLCVYGKFNDVINDLLDQIDNKLIPSFFFIDPFGYTGVPFKTVERILKIPKTEVFLNFMIRDINRFLSIPNQEENLNNLYGDDSWKQYIKLKGNERQIALRNLYMDKLIGTKCAKYVWPFKICEDTKCATLYYLIYATNNFKGLDVMKSIMFKQSEHFAYLGPQEFAYQNSRKQLRMFDFNILGLMDFFLKYFSKGMKKTYEQIKQETYMLTPCVDKHYRKALKELEKQGKIGIIRRTSKTCRGLKGDDLIIF